MRAIAMALLFALLGAQGAIGQPRPGAQAPGAEQVEMCGRITRLQRNALWMGKTLVVITPRTEVRQGRLPLAAARLRPGQTVVVRGVWVQPGTLRAIRVVVLPE